MMNKGYMNTYEKTVSGDQAEKDFNHIFTFQLDVDEEQSVNDGPLFLNEPGLLEHEPHEQTREPGIQDPHSLFLPRAGVVAFPVTLFASKTDKLNSRGVSLLFMAPISYRAKMSQLSEGK